MTTAPYAAAVADVIRGPHRHVCRARLTHPTLPAPVELILDPEEGHRVSVDVDGARAPRFIVELSCALPTGVDPATLDPRTGIRLELELGYAAPSIGEDVATLNLGMRKIGEDVRSGGISITAAGDEALALDGAPAVAGTVTAASHAAAVELLLAQLITPAPRFTATLTGPAVTLDPVPDRWEAISDLADRLEGRVFDDGTRAWRLEATPTLAGTPDLELAAGDGSTLIDATAELDRDLWHNYVMLSYEWRDAAGTDQTIRATAYASSGPYAITGPAGRRILKITRTVPTTQAEANTAAAAILRREITRGQTGTLEAVAAYWIRPGSTVRATLGTRTAVDYLIDRVIFRPLEATMTLYPRTPETAPGVSSSTTGASPSTDPTPPAASTRTSTWKVSTSASYAGNGTKRTDLGTEVAAGWGGAGVGDGQAVLMFTAANSTGSETGKTIGQALTAARVHAVALTITSTAARRSPGSTMRLGGYNGTTLPATKTGDETFTASTEWPAGVERTVTLTGAEFVAQLEAGTALGVVLGPTGDFDGMRFDPATAALTITYAK